MNQPIKVNDHVSPMILEIEVTDMILTRQLLSARGISAVEIFKTGLVEMVNRTELLGEEHIISLDGRKLNVQKVVIA